MTTQLKSTADTAALAKALAKMPQIAARVAERSAPKLSAYAMQSFDARMSPSGIPWGPGKKGPITLHRSGRLRAAALQYRASGTKIRSSVTQVPYAKYHIRRGILPRGGAALPASWEAAIREVSVEEIRAMLAKGGAL